MTLPIPDVPPGAHISETDFSEQLRRALNAPGRPTRCWRQNAGQATIRTATGRVMGVFHGAPTGAADLSGIVSPSGRRLEIELKVDHVHTVEQKTWATFIERMGGIYVLIRYDHALPLAANVAAAVQQIDAAVTAVVTP